jgi:hypothetical protein
MHKARLPLPCSAAQPLTNLPAAGKVIGSIVFGLPLNRFNIEITRELFCQTIFLSKKLFFKKFLEKQKHDLTDIFSWPYICVENAEKQKQKHLRSQAAGLGWMDGSLHRGLATIINGKSVLYCAGGRLYSSSVAVSDNCSTCGVWPHRNMPRTEAE